MALPVRVVMHDLETPESYAIRLCAANGFSSYRMFLKLTKMTSAGLSKGEPDSIRHLARWSATDPQTLSRYVAVMENRFMTWRLGSAKFNKEARPGRRFRYCPCCVVEDLDNGRGPTVSRPFVRPSWACRAVTNCVEHRRPLSEAPHSPIFGNDFCSFVAVNLSLIRMQAEDPRTQTFAAVDAYCEGKIRGISDEHYLDTMEAYVAVDLCTHLGRFIKRYRSALKLVPLALRGAAAREVGFHFASQGEECIREIVTKIIRTERPKGTAKFMFGSLGRWLRANSARPEFKDVLELLQDVAERSLPFGQGEMCFIPVRKRYLHSVHSAAAEYGLFDRRVAELVTEAGLVDDSSLSGGRIYFDADKAHEILLAATKTVTSSQARSILGVDEKSMASLLQSGLLARVEVRSSGRNYSRIRREDLNNLLRGIFANVSVGTVEPDWMTMRYLCQKAVCGKEDVLAALLHGNLTDAAAPTNHGLKISSLRFNPSTSVRQILSTRKTISDVAGMQAFSQKEASAYMHVKVETVPYLVKEGFIEAMEIQNPIVNRRQKVVTVTSLDAFRKKYIAVSEVAANYETHTNVILAAFQKVGVRPIYEAGAAVSRFFLRSDIDNAPVEVPNIKKRNRKR